MEKLPNPFDAITEELTLIRAMLSEKNEQHGIKAEPEYGDIHYAARITTFAAGTIKNMVCQKKIPHKKIGGRVIFKKVDLHKWMDSFDVPTEEEEVQKTLKNMKIYQR